MIRSVDVFQNYKSLALVLVKLALEDYLNGNDEDREEAEEFLLGDTVTYFTDIPGGFLIDMADEHGLIPTNINALIGDITQMKLSVKNTGEGYAGVCSLKERSKKTRKSTSARRRF